jgi:hypothetical protein
MNGLLYRQGMKTADRRYLIEFGGAMLAYTAAVFVSAFGVGAMAHDNPWRYPLAVLPVVPSVFALLAFIRRLRVMDELQRRIQFEAFGITLGVGVLGTLTYGFLEEAGLPHLPLIWVGPALIATWGVTSAIVVRRFA